MPGRGGREIEGVWGGGGAEEKRGRGHEMVWCASKDGRTHTYLGLSTNFSISTLSSPKLFKASLLQESNACWKSADLRTIRIPYIGTQKERDKKTDTNDAPKG